MCACVGGGFFPSWAVRADLHVPKVRWFDSGYPTLRTKSLAPPEPNTVLPVSVSGRGSDGNERKDKETRSSQTQMQW